MRPALAYSAFVWRHYVIYGLRCLKNRERIALQPGARTVFHHLVQFHENPAAVQWWCRKFARILVWLTPPARRRGLLAYAALLIGCVSTIESMAKHLPLQFPIGTAGAIVVFFLHLAFVAMVYWAATRFSHLPAVVRRHPQWSLHGVYWMLLALLWLTPASSAMWRPALLGLAIMLPMLLWRLGYLVLGGQHGRLAGTGWRDHAFYLWPAYGGSQTPYGKGLTYLSQHEARTTEGLARSQLAGARLLLLALLWRLVLTAFEGLVYGSGNGLTRAVGGLTVGLPELRDLLAQGAHAPRAVAWASVYAELFADVLRLSVKGHLIIGFLRLYGFNVFRNTYKPLLAETVVEFWSRYFYYFKELLVTFFFMPTFTGLGRRLHRWPAFRLLLAVFAAAFIGNAYYHVIKESAALAQGQLPEVLVAQGARMFYCFLLAAGIGVSMLREQKRRGVDAQRGRMPRPFRIFGVWTFFGLISIWNIRAGAGFADRTDFFLMLWGLA